MVGITKKKGRLEKSEKLKGQTNLTNFLELNNKAKNTPTSQQPSSEVLSFKAKNSKRRWEEKTTEAEKITGDRSNTAVRDISVVGKGCIWVNSSPSFHEGELNWGWGSKFWAIPTTIFLKSDFFHTRKGKGEFFEFGPLKI